MLSFSLRRKLEGFILYAWNICSLTILSCYSLLEMTRKGKASLQSTDKEAISAVSGGSGLEQRSTTDSVEHAPQVSVAFHSVPLWG